jgi:hypothetical protein
VAYQQKADYLREERLAEASTPSTGAAASGSVDATSSTFGRRKVIVLYGGGREAFTDVVRKLRADYQDTDQGQRASWSQHSFQLSKSKARMRLNYTTERLERKVSPTIQDCLEL